MRHVTASLLAAAALLVTLPVHADPGIHVTYLWHQEQPIYWPAPNDGGHRYETGWESLQDNYAGEVHPENDLEEIFGKDDRVAVYQWRVRDAINAIQGHGDAGAQVSYSGGLIENIRSFGAANQLGYSPSWSEPYREARTWLTADGHPRLEIVQFPFHHALLPLVHPEVARMEIALYQHAYGPTWGADNASRGLFPSEMAFAEHLIPVLEERGIDWVIVSNSHLSRATENYPWVAGSGGDNISPPNRWDQQNPAQDHFNRISIDRGVSPANAVPFAYTPHHAEWIDPDTGDASRVVVVPAAQSESWRDGYSCFGVEDVDALSPYDTGDRPMLLLLAHDGDNAFGGGFSYYLECTPNFIAAAAGNGHAPTTVPQYLADHPVPESDVVHVESGAWVNADGDFGAPTFWNWNWPLVNERGEVDIVNGWAEDERGWAVITAATNYVLTAEAIHGRPDMQDIYEPTASSGDVAEAWHFLLGALNSGYMYYGAAIDMELKPVVGSNAAMERAQRALSGTSEDPIGPTIWYPQRYPDNPGGHNFGPLYGYRDVIGDPDFLVWTFAHDLSGIREATVWVREDHDGVDPISSRQNQTYAGGGEVGEWRQIPMNVRDFPTGNPFDNPEISTEILPTEIADAYYATVEGYRDTLVDYFVEAIDNNGNVSRSPIAHVYIGSEDPVLPEGPVRWEPASPAYAQDFTIFAPNPGWIHWGVNGWTEPSESIWPTGTASTGNGMAVETPLQGPNGDGDYYLDFDAFGAAAGVEVLDFVIRGEDGNWDNNGGSDYHISFRATAEDVGPTDTGHPDTGTEDTGVATDTGAGADTGIPDSGEDMPDIEPSDVGVGDTGRAPDIGDDTELPADDDEGCGCTSTPRTAPGWWGAIALGLLVRRRRSRDPELMIAQARPQDLEGAR